MTTAKFPFWRVVPTEGCGPQEGDYVLPVTRPATVGPEGAGHVMGGVALAAAIDALELASEQPLLWINMQFLSPTQHVEELAIRARQCGGGQSIGQWQADMHVKGRPTHRVSAALGARGPSERKLFATMPDVSPPGDCDPVQSPAWGEPGALHDQVEMRIAAQDFDRGTIAIWTRSTSGFDNDAGWLAIVSDFFLGGHPQSAGGSSLDATFRFVQGCKAGWVLSVTEMAAFDRGTAHGGARHFAEDGKLLAISSQTGVLPRNPRMENE